MQRTATDIMTPVMQIIRKMQEAKTPEEKATLEKELYATSDLAFSELKAFDEEFLKIRDKNIELEDKLKEINELLDKRMSELDPYDMADSMAACEHIYAGFWEKLDEYSQKYLAMANYLYKLFSKDEKDFSPSVLEFGRAVENELVIKIYHDYIAGLSGNTQNMRDHGSLYGDLKSAIRSYTNNNGEYYLSARAMVRFLTYLSNEEIENDYNEALKTFLETQGVDRLPISEETFTTNADQLFDEYRNSAAHPGGTMELADAKICKEKSKKVLKKFMSAVG